MLCNALGRFGDATLGAPGGYAQAYEGLKTFDSVQATLRQRQDTIQRSIASALTAYPEPRLGGPSVSVGAALGSAVAAFAASEGGRACVHDLTAAAGGFLRNLFAPGGPVQLPLPLEL